MDKHVCVCETISSLGLIVSGEVNTKIELLPPQICATVFLWVNGVSGRVLKISFLPYNIDLLCYSYTVVHKIPSFFSCMLQDRKKTVFFS